MSHGDLPTRLFSVANTLASEAIANSTAKTTAKACKAAASSTSAAQPCRCSFQASAPKLRTVGLTANRPKIGSLPPRVVQNGSQLYLLMSWIGG